MNNTVVQLPIRETEQVVRLINHCRFLKYENDRLEDHVKHLELQKLEYNNGYRDGVRDAIDRLEALMSASVLDAIKQGVVNSLRCLYDTPETVPQAPGNGDPF